MLRVLVVDDSAVARRLLVQILETDPDLKVVAEASDGAEAVKLARRLLPDVITMDIHMPVMDGLEATRRIMEQTPRPIVLVSASVEPYDVTRSFRALEAGALTLLGKPEMSADADLATEASSLVDTVKLMADVKVVTRRRRDGAHRRATASSSTALKEPIELIAMAASTGGPAALAKVFSAMPADTPVPILVVQHIANGFDRGLIEWLDSASPLHVRLGVHGQTLRPGEVTFAPHGFHVGVLSDGTLALTRGKPVAGHRPSATHLFTSVARTYGPRALGVIMTGMGADGVTGLLELRRAGGWVLAQDEASSVVYGMPRAAVALGAVDEIVALEDIANVMLAVFRCRSSRMRDDDPDPLRNG